MAQTAAHLVDRVIPPVPVRQWVISVPKQLRWFLADRPETVTALTTIFLGEIERLLRESVGMSHAENAPPSAQPRFGAVSFLHHLGFALNRHVHLHTCVTDGVFTRGRGGVTFLPARPISPADLATLTERVRHRVVRCFRRRRIIDAKAAADMLAWQAVEKQPARSRTRSVRENRRFSSVKNVRRTFSTGCWENSGFSIDASVRIALVDRDVPGYFQSLEHLVRSCARPAFASPVGPTSGSPYSSIATATQSGSATRSPATSAAPGSAPVARGSRPPPTPRASSTSRPTSCYQEDPHARGRAPRTAAARTSPWSAHGVARTRPDT
jgi:hypothetical protein